jgi:tRNA pseudouridine55 synthase
MSDQIQIPDELTEEGMVLSIDKPLDWTSFDVVKKVRVLFDIKKVGHAGTLDPKATGLLIICTGKKTKSIDQYVGLEKEYSGTCKIGERTPSFDTETAVHEWKDSSAVTERQIRETARQFIGKQYQLPPMYSAVKFAGKPLYLYARAGRSVERIEREVDIARFDILDMRAQEIDFCIVCSKGTYIRSLIDEFGLKLGCGATLTALRRTRIGNFTVAEALSIAQLIELQQNWKRTQVMHV